MIREAEKYNSVRKLLCDAGLYIAVIVVCGLLLIGYAAFAYGALPALAAGMIPIGVALFVIGLQRPREAFFAFFIMNYFIMGIDRYSKGAAFPFGTVIDVFIAYLALVLVLQRIFNSSRDEKQGKLNGFTFVSFIWLCYTFFELFNTGGMMSAWLTSFRGVALHMFAVSFFAPLIITRFKDFKIFLGIWSVLTVLAVLKALAQKFIGFDDAEMYWLFVSGGQITHLIGYGVRYFSFFTDAANFGAAMGMSATVFAICAIFIRKTRLKVWFAAVASLALYGMLISGTRAALAVPFTGFSVLVFLSRKPKLIIVFSCLLLAFFCFLKFTYIGHGNYMIRRMRSALNPNDPSMVIRTENKAKLKVYMADKPFGAGLGMGGVKAKRYTGAETYLSTIPTDSWFVMLWVETGIVGLVLNLAILAYIMGFGVFQVLFRIKNDLLRGLNIAMIAGCSGMIAASYANEILGQIPNGIIIYTSMAMIFLSPLFDKELSAAGEDRKNLAEKNEGQ